MRAQTLYRSILVVLIIYTGSGCSDDHIQAPGADEWAIEFFHQLYNQRDLERAAALATPEYAEVLLRYGTVNAVGRYLYNMNFDHVEIEADRQGIDWYQQRPDMVRVQLSFSGYSGSRRFDYVRDVVMVREGSQWRLARVLDHPMR